MGATIYTVYETRNVGLLVSHLSPLERQNIVFDGVWEHCQRWMEHAERGLFREDVECQHLTHVQLAGHYMGQVQE